jgi:hypothetical protein
MSVGGSHNALPGVSAINIISTKGNNKFLQLSCPYLINIIFWEQFKQPFAGLLFPYIVLPSSCSI